MNVESSSLRWRARVHAALGDPARLAIVDTLRLGDASPGELAHRLRLPTNLVAHHVKVLQAAGLLERTRSEGDRRRTYLRLRPDTLAALAPPAPLPGVGRVVFVCTYNSARSQLAAALWGSHGRPVPAASAGTRPAARVHPRALAVAHRHGLALEPTGTAHVSDVLSDGDLVIAVCDNAHEDLTGRAHEDSTGRAHEDLTGQAREGSTGTAGPTGRPRLHWSVPDPVRVDTDAAFEAAYTDLADRIGRLAPAIASGARHD